MPSQKSNTAANKTSNATQYIAYASYALAKKEIATIEPIDYFFAKDLVQAFISNNTKFTVQESFELFHLLMALSQSLREGHICLPLQAISNSRYGYLSDDFGLVLHHGYVFSNTEILNDLLIRIKVSCDAEQPVVYHNNKLYMRRYFQFEQELFKGISLKSNTLSLDFSKEQPKETFEIPSNIHIKNCIDSFFPKTENDTDTDSDTEIDWQKIAVANALNKNFSVIAGGPGTGKTYTVTKLLAALVYLHQQSCSNKPSATLNIALVAPTGKAAQRLSESIIKAITGFRGDIADDVLDKIPSDTYTIHRLLGVIPNSPNFRFNENNRLNIDVLLIDEVSMVDLAMMNRVFRALPPHCKVVLLGDADQLPSVSAGSVLSDIAPRPFLGYSADNVKYLKQVSGISVAKISKAAEKQQALNSIALEPLGVIETSVALNTVSASTSSTTVTNRCDNVTFLTKSRRFDGEGGIGRLAQAVIAGSFEQSWALLNKATGRNEITHLQGELVEWLWPLVKQYYLPIFTCGDVAEAFKLLSNFRVLCATRVGEQGVEFLNELITSLLMNKGVIKTGDDYSNVSSNKLYQGRPIMISENNYHQGLYNGDIGFLWKNESGNLMAVFEDANNSYRWIMTSKLPHYETVYAMTIHKTQGSEFTHVAMILPNQKDNRLLSRELLYTGITRAKTQISIATHARVWRQGVETKVKRYSGHSSDI